MSHKENFHSGQAPEAVRSQLLDAASALANRTHWDADAHDYHERHRSYLEGFYWCPEMLSEHDAQLLGDISDTAVLEVGCGSAPCSDWLAQEFPTAFITAMDISRGMLEQSSRTFSLAQANALQLPYASEAFDTVFSAFGAIPFVKDLTALFTEIARVLKPGGRFIYSTNHPMRWVFPDDPGEAGLQASIPYFERDYVEKDEHGTITYAEFQHTIADHLNAISRAGLVVTGCLEPEWPEQLTQNWGQWSPLRGNIFPGTIIFSTHKN